MTKVIAFQNVSLVRTRHILNLKTISETGAY